jgi:glycosyltransferase involved in cell wall biosynthesis
MADADLRTRLASAALDLSRQFTWEAIGRRHLEIYREFV